MLLFNGVESTPTPLLLADLFRDGTLKEIYRGLREQVPTVSAEDVQDALGHALVATLTSCQSEPPQNPAGYLFVAAKNHLLRVMDRRTRLRTENVDPDTQPDNGSRPDHNYDHKDLYSFLKRLVARWDNERMRTIVELVLDAAVEGVVMTGAELAEEAEAITGEKFSISSVYEWKTRGLRRLHEELEHSTERTAKGDRTDDKRKH